MKPRKTRRKSKHKAPATPRGVAQRPFKPRDEKRFEAQARHIRQLFSDGAQKELEAMREIYRLSLPRNAFLWKRHRQHTFEELLKEEGFCTISRFRDFQKAEESKIFTKAEMEILGVDAVCLIAKQPRGQNPGPKTRAQERRIRAHQRDLIDQALAYRRDPRHKEPTYQYVTQLLPKEPNKSKGPTNSELKAYIKILQDALVRAGQRPPSPPWARRRT